MTERLINVEKDGKMWVTDNDFTRENGIVVAIMKKLREYETAEEEGRLVILPKCNIGDTVYIPIDFQNKIYTGTVDGFEYSPRRNKWVVKIITDDGEKCYEAFDDFGKTFFLDIEDAAKALKEMTKGEMTY